MEGMEAIEARDEALEQVARNSKAYVETALKLIQEGTYMPAYVTGEDVRLAVEAEIGKPHHPNAWGAIINAAVRQRLLFPTGVYRKMRSKRSHARKTPEYYTTAAVRFGGGLESARYDE